MSLRSDWSHDSCPVARGIDAIGDGWVLLILREALAGARRFDEFKSRLALADNILSARLGYMVEEGLLDRQPYTEGKRPRMEYLLTESGADALTVLHSFALWADRNRPRSAATDEFHIHCLECGTISSRGESCSQCGALLTPERVAWSRPGRWRGETVQLTGASRRPLAAD